MASNIQPISKLCLVFTLLSFILISSADNFYQYEVNGSEMSDVLLRPLKIIKRQADKSKPLLKDQSGMDTENSPNNKTVDVPTTEATFTTESETEALDITTISSFPANDIFPDFDGSNITLSNATEDHHQYYNSTTYLNSEIGLHYWVDFDQAHASVTDKTLSQSHRRATTIALSFDFPYYGHSIRNITIATGGFLYTGQYVHPWLAATQYIAPLMANFYTSMSNSSTIKYIDNGTALTVQWENVVLQDKAEAGNFTFQATLLKTGDIVFVYKQIPVPVTSILNRAHPVIVGLSDAYMIDRTLFSIKQKTLYEYHKVNLKKDEIRNGTAVYFSALPTCFSLKSCASCVSNTLDFNCVWCPSADRCSDGMDRSRQEWLTKGCDKVFFDHNSNCSASSSLKSDDNQPTETTTSAVPTSTAPTVTPNSREFDPSDSQSMIDDADESANTDVSSVVGILFLVAFIVCAAGWIFYAYRNPHTSSGQCFIRYRPSQWRWRSGEAHYTAAAIHM